MTTQDTIATAEAEEAWREAIAEEPEPVANLPDGFLKEGEVISTPSESSPSASRVSSLRYKGYLSYWDTKTPLPDRKSTRLNSSHSDRSRMPSSA